MTAIRYYYSSFGLFVFSSHSSVSPVSSASSTSSDQFRLVGLLHRIEGLQLAPLSTKGEKRTRGHGNMKEQASMGTTLESGDDMLP